MIVTNHAFSRAAERGIDKNLLFKAMKLDSNYYSSQFGNGSNIKRVFNEINLLIKLSVGEISEEEFSTLRNLCLVVSESGETLISVFRKQEIRC